MSELATWAKKIASDAAQTSMSTALTSLAEAVRMVAESQPDYSVTVQVTCGPVSLSVTVPGRVT